MSPRVTTRSMAVIQNPIIVDDDEADTASSSRSKTTMGSREKNKIVPPKGGQIKGKWNDPCIAKNLVILDADEPSEKTATATASKYKAAILRPKRGASREVTFETQQQIDQHRAVEDLIECFPGLHEEHAINYLEISPADYRKKAFISVNVLNKKKLELERILSYISPFLSQLPIGIVASSFLKAVWNNDALRARLEEPSLRHLPFDVFEANEPPESAGPYYYDWCMHSLSNEFLRITLRCIKLALFCNKKRLGPAYQSLYYHYRLAFAKESGQNVSADEASTSVTNAANASWVPKGGLRLNKYPRIVSKAHPIKACPLFDGEWAVIQNIFSVVKEGEGMQEVVSPPVSQEIDCGCCFSECRFEEMVQCADGHLFCFTCLRRHVEESTFGASQTHGCLPCMDTDGCIEYIPWSEVVRALPADVILKYEKRQAENAVARARLSGLVYCPFCNFPCDVDKGISVLLCPYEGCKKASCIDCKEPDHRPLRCEEVEKKTETSLRRQVEESMTKAIIRVCTGCKAELLKLDGCNKITCRCGQTMCYICRMPIPPNYSHFCQHGRDPGKPCLHCKRCGLWDKEEENNIVKDAKNKAIAEVSRHEPNILKRAIGPSDTPLKRMKSAPIHAPRALYINMQRG